MLCCDRTGTLTEGHPSLHGFLGADGSPDPAVLLYGALAGSLGTGTPAEPVPNPIDRAIWASQALGEQRAELARWCVLDRNAFDFRRRRGSALVTNGHGHCAGG